jgi:L-fucose mutarotase/ribose pyranase (RbsD/FucU family)
VNRDKEILKMPIETPASVTGEKFNGSGTVVDFTTTGSKAFYTVQTTDHSVYYIIIDLDKTESNVYFLSEINGEELSLSEVASKDGSMNKESATATDNKVQKVEKTEIIEPNLLLQRKHQVRTIGRFGFFSLVQSSYLVINSSLGN